MHTNKVNTMKRNYPKNRKQRFLTNTQTYRIQNGPEWAMIKDYFIENGIYKTGERFDISPGILRYVMKKQGIRRPLPLHLEIAYLRGKWPVSGAKLVTNYVPVQLEKPIEENS